MSPELILEAILDELKLWYEKEFRFHKIRKWRFDFAITSRMTAIEIEGAVFQNGRHTRGKGFSNDCEKYNAAALLGWKVLRYTVDVVQKSPNQIAKDIKFIKERGRI